MKLSHLLIFIHLNLLLISLSHAYAIQSAYLEYFMLCDFISFHHEITPSHSIQYFLFSLLFLPQMVNTDFH